ncbi:hypothetical protein [Parafrankia discariae]|uniref:hypothetical protein n=1 Tax=Parafrankia discariae TaxID=365528 RepID=UPI00039A2FB7|nr:hypothetical protein [Parafrankia discariae]
MQVRELEDLARRLQKARVDKTERITANTLLRIAADLLLARSGELSGDTEEQLRRSVGLPENRSSGVRKSRASRGTVEQRSTSV